jgi:ABC-type Mn2+/Zn2+ transport system ATPase subunit
MKTKSFHCIIIAGPNGAGKTTFAGSATIRL